MNAGEGIGRCFRVSVRQSGLSAAAGEADGPCGAAPFLSPPLIPALPASSRMRSTIIRPQEATCFKKMVTRIGKEYLPGTWERKYYADQYSCMPPPLFMPCITCIQVITFYLTTRSTGSLSSDQVLEDNLFVFRPDEKKEVWRFLMYMFVHAEWVHLLFNLTIQLLVGLPLEMVHGSGRLAIIYLSGVLAGSLGSSVFDRNAVLVGASGGVYALLAAHLANVLLNYQEMQLGVLRVVAIISVASVDVGFAVYDRFSNESNQHPVSFVAHVTGALAGLTIGLVVLKNFEQKLREQMIWWLALGIYMSCLLFAVLYNVFY